jgi:hypothetical protein
MNHQSHKYPRPWLMDAARVRPHLCSAADAFSKKTGRGDDPEARRERARRKSWGLLEWGRRMLPEHFQLPPSLMHVWLAEELDAWRKKRGQRVNVIGPRGAAKSTLGTLAYPLRVALQGQEPYIWIVSDTRPQACLHLENIKTELLDNVLLREAYPYAVGRGPLWRQGAIILRNGVAIEAFGTLQRMPGRTSSTSTMYQCRPHSAANCVPTCTGVLSLRGSPGWTVRRAAAAGRAGDAGVMGQAIRSRWQSCDSRRSLPTSSGRPQSSAQ